jgi:hypothetical protein
MPVTAFHDLLDPRSGERCDVVSQGGLVLEDAVGVRAGRHIDASGWWLLPAIFDADAHMPFVPAGLRSYDLYAALWGGVAHMVIALPFQLVRGHDLRLLVTELTRTRLPEITPVISVLPTEDSAGFPAWLQENSAAVHDLLAKICKLYTPDPNFRANLDAVWEAGLTPAVFAYTPREFEELMAVAHAPLHVRHATSAAMVDAVHAKPGLTVQTSPHMLLPLAPGRREQLAVLPAPPADDDRESLLAAVAKIDLIASDHVSPPLGEPTGPGLQTQQHFAPALLTLAQRTGIPLGRLWEKVTAGPARVFGVRPAPGFVVVDPAARETVRRWPRQREDRAPYLGSELAGRTIAVASGGRIVMV